MYVYAAGISVEVGAHYPGRPGTCPGTGLSEPRGTPSASQESAEAIVRHIDRAEGPNVK